MSVSAISYYRGGSIEELLPLAKRLKAAYARFGIGYRLSRAQTGPNTGDWLVIVQYADEAAYKQALAEIDKDDECQRAFNEIAKFAKRISREIVTDIEV